MTLKKFMSFLAVWVFILAAILFCDAIFFNHERLAITLTDEPNAAFVAIGHGRYYDPHTYIVYLGTPTYDSYIVPIPYRSSNGLQCKFNPRTNSIEEVNK